MADSLWMRLRETSWSKYESAPASKKLIPKILENLASRKEARAMKATHDLWVALCSGGPHSAAEPCLPFLMEIFDISSDSVQEELLDVFMKLAQKPDADAEEWRVRMHDRFIRDRVFFEGMRHSRNERVVEKAATVLSHL